MLGSETLEIAIGIIFVYILVSIICTAIREGVEAWLKTRAAYLERGIRELLHDKDGKGLTADFYNHPLILSLFSDDYKTSIKGNRLRWFARGGNLPSYIPSKNFAMALMDIAARGPKMDAAGSEAGAPIISLDSVRANISNIQNDRVKRVLLTAIDSAQGDLNKAQANLEGWYNSAMDRVSGWYKRSTQGILFLIGILVAVGLNIDTLTLADYLQRNDTTRAALVERAGTAATDKDFLNKNYDEVNKEIQDLKLPIGWSHRSFMGWDKVQETRFEDWHFWDQVFGPLLGWLLTALAATLGAPFWFDVLNKVMVIRSTVKPREKSQEEGSEDRQAAPQVLEVRAQGQVSNL